MAHWDRNGGGRDIVCVFEQSHRVQIYGWPTTQNEGVSLNIPAHLAASCHKTPERTAWLDGLPDALRELARRWSLKIGAPFDGEDVSCAWVAPVMLSDGTTAVLKLGMPHMEGAHELQGLRFWNGDPTVRLLQADEELGAMLLERCEPGTVLRSLPECTQDLVTGRQVLFRFGDDYFSRS